MSNRTERTRISQLTSTYGPDEPPRLPMDFGDYLSLIWRLDKHADDPAKVKYYRRCALSLAEGLGLKGRSVFRLVELAPPGALAASQRALSRHEPLLDAQDHKAAIAQLATLRQDICAGVHDQWPVGWPGSAYGHRLTRASIRGFLRHFGAV
jgi:hypothetical protein